MAKAERPPLDTSCREAVSRLFERGLNIAEVGAISGHKEVRMLQRYTHLRAADLVRRLDMALPRD